MRGKKEIQGYISVVQRMTDFWKGSQIWSPILRIFFQCKHQNAMETSLVEILGPAQREVNPRESWGIRSPPLKGEETQSREEEGEIFPTLGNQPLNLLNLLEERRVTPLIPKRVLHVPTPPIRTHRHSTVTSH